MYGRSCTVVLVGSNTAGRKWINHEIIESWNDGMGVVGIHIHGLKNLDGKVATKGSNPFANITYGAQGKKLSSIVNCYTRRGARAKNDTLGLRRIWRLPSRRQFRYGKTTNLEPLS